MADHMTAEQQGSANWERHRRLARQALVEARVRFDAMDEVFLGTLLMMGARVNGHVGTVSMALVDFVPAMKMLASNIASECIAIAHDSMIEGRHEH